MQTGIGSGVRASVLCMAGFIAGCGAGDGDGASSSDSSTAAAERADAAYFPLDVGREWTYRATFPGFAPDTLTLTVAVEASTAIPGIGAGVVLRQGVSGAAGRTVAVPRSDGLFVYAYDRTDAADVAATDGGVLVVWPARSGETRTEPARVDELFDRDGDGVKDRHVVEVSTTVVGFESVTTPAGTFPAAMRQRTTYRQTTDYSRSGRTVTTSTADLWFVRDVGLVREADHDGDGSLRTTIELVARGTSTASSDIAPAVRASDLPAAVLRGIGRAAH